MEPTIAQSPESISRYMCMPGERCCTFGRGHCRSSALLTIHSGELQSRPGIGVQICPRILPVSSSPSLTQDSDIHPSLILCKPVHPSPKRYNPACTLLVPSLHEHYRRGDRMNPTDSNPHDLAIEYYHIEYVSVKLCQTCRRAP